MCLLLTGNRDVGYSVQLKEYCKMCLFVVVVVVVVVLVPFVFFAVIVF